MLRFSFLQCFGPRVFLYVDSCFSPSFKVEGQLAVACSFSWEGGAACLLCVDTSLSVPQSLPAFPSAPPTASHSKP